MSSVQNSAKAASKQINIYIRRHPFVLSSIESFTTSQRRAFLRGVYDYARSLGLDRKESKQQIIKAREMCGEEEYDTDVSALENEVDDSETILSRLCDPIYTGQGTAALSRPGVLSLSRQNSRSSMSDSTTSQTQKRRKIDMGPEKKNGTMSQSAMSIPQRRAVTQPTNRVINDKRPKQIRDSVSGTGSSEDRGFQRKGRSQSLSQQNSSTERELLLTTKPMLSYDPADPEREMETNTSQDQTTSHSNTVAITSTTSFPATTLNSKNIKTSKQNFVPPEVATFSDEEDLLAI